MRCVVHNCKNVQKLKKNLISFHRFPHMLDLKSKWICALGLVSDHVITRSVVCSEHFFENDFIGNSKSSRNLFPSAVPHLAAVGDEIDIDSLSTCSSKTVEADKEHINKEHFKVIKNVQIAPLKAASIQNAPTTNVELEKVKKMTLKIAIAPRDDYNDKFRVLRQVIEKQNRKIKTLNEKVRRKTRRIAYLTQTITKLKKANK